MVSEVDISAWGSVLDIGGRGVARQAMGAAAQAAAAAVTKGAEIRARANDLREHARDTVRVANQRTAPAKARLSAVGGVLSNAGNAVVHAVQRFRYRKRNTRAAATANAAISSRNNGPIVHTYENPVESTGWRWRRRKQRNKRLDAVENLQKAMYDINNDVAGVRSDNALNLAATARVKFGHTRFSPAQHTVVRRFVASQARPDGVDERMWPVLIDNATMCYFMATDTDLARGAYYKSAKFLALNSEATIAKA